MVSLASRVFTKIVSFFSETSRFKLQQFLPVFLVLAIFFGTNVNPSFSNPSVSKKLNEVVHQDDYKADTQRPKTTGEWKGEAREVEGKPLQRAERILKESGEAVKDFGSVYPDTAQRSVTELKDGGNKAG
ncbi:MAG TPA: hypothetical protein V6D19_03645 [Stenomitos sp.]